MTVRTLICLALAGALFLGTAAPSQVRGQSAPVATESRASGAEEQDLSRVLNDAYAIIRNPEVDESLKSATVDELFRNFDSRCQANCDIPLKVLRRFNELAESAPAKTLIEKLKESRISQIAQNAEQVTQAGKRIEKYLSTLDPKSLSYRITATMELLRFVISLRERTLFALASQPSPSPEVRDQIARDIEQLTKQLKAMQELGSIVVSKVKVAYGETGDGASSVKAGAAPTSPADDTEKLSLTPDEAKRIAQAVNDLDIIIFKKIIQSVSNNSIVMGSSAQKFFKQFQDDLPKIPAEVVARTIEEDLGKRPEELFVDFDAEKPIASATIGQTYKAKVRTLFGLKDVIVKVRRPGLEESLDKSRAIDALLLKLGKIVLGSGENAPLFEVLADQVTGLEDAIGHEMNFEHEFEQLERARYLLALQFGVRVPKPLRRLSTSRVLTMEVLPGENIDSLLTAAKEISEKERVKMYGRVIDVFLFQTVVLGELHGDMHPGNVLATREGGLGLIDWAHVFRSRGMFTYPARAFYSLFTGHAEEFAAAFAKMNSGSDFPLAAFTARVKEIFEQNKIKRISLWQLLRNESELDMEDGMKLLGKIYLEAARMNFRVTPAYFQFVRSALPVASVLVEIGKGLSTEQKKRIAITKLVTLAPLGAVKALGGHALELLTRPQRELSRRFTEAARPAGGPPACRAALDP